MNFCYNEPRQCDSSVHRLRRAAAAAGAAVSEHRLLMLNSAAALLSVPLYFGLCCYYC